LAQWTAFRKKLPNTECPEKLSDVVLVLAEFLLPIARAREAGERFERSWPPGGGVDPRNMSRSQQRTPLHREAL